MGPLLPAASVSASDPHRSARGPRGRQLVVAHRGASGAAPENTLAALRRAVAMGVDMVEVDVQRTRDGALVLLHDTTLTRTTDARVVLPGRRPWRVGDLTLEEVRRLDAGRWFGPEYAGEQVPTLQEAIDVLHAGGVGLQLELKHPELYPGVVDDLATELVSRHTYVRHTLPLGRLVVQSFDFASMKALKTRLPRLPVGLLGQPAEANLPALATWADQVNPRHLLVDADYVQAVQDAGMDCLVWTVDRPRAVQRALGMGVDGVITNRPEVLQELLRTGGTEPVAARRG
jgi:glycerophosphoryl diester phosphodiesterase